MLRTMVPKRRAAMSLRADDEKQIVEALARELRKLKFRKPQERYSWGKPALDVLDCVLSLHRRYKKVVEPRIDRFKAKNPEVQSLGDLMGMISRFGKTKFLGQELGFNDPGRARTLVGVVKYLMDVQGKFPGKDERERLRNWAARSKPEHSEEVKVRGFGLAGFQYLRMLFGAQTLKPDVHMRRFVYDVIGKKVPDWRALECLERAAKREKLPLRDVDWEIWERSADDAR